MPETITDFIFDDIFAAMMGVYQDRRALAEQALELRDKIIGRFASRWIPATERTPPPSFEVLITDGESVMAGIWSGREWETHGPCGYDYMPGITHWMPLPEPPTTER